jgi:acyl-CoA synthetase (NDP forming)
MIKSLLESTIAVNKSYDQKYVDNSIEVVKVYEQELINKTVQIMEKYNKPIIGVYLLTDETSRTVMEIDGHKYKGVIFPTPERAVKALANMYNYSQWLKDSAI